MATENNNIPKEFICPITLEIMREPIDMPDGVTYEKDAIKYALEKIHISPITKKEMNLSDGVINETLKNSIENFINEHDIHLANIEDKIKNLTFDETLLEENKNSKLELKEKKIEKIEFEELHAHYIPKETSSILNKDFIHIYMKPKKN